jgi:hypothetical protein
MSSYNEAVDYIIGRQKGDITSLKTPWAKFNDVGADGLEWNSVVVIGGRPAAGKSLIKDQIIRESFALNPTESFNVLKFELEMLGRATAIREFSGVIGKSYKHLCSADGKLSDVDLDRCKQYVTNRVDIPIHIIEDPVTVPMFIKIVSQYMEHHASTVTRQRNVFNGEKFVLIEETTKVYKKTLISLDHTFLVLKAATESSKLDTLYALGEALTLLKRKYPILFLVLSQLNRNIDFPERNEDGKYGNFVLESDFMGADAMNQHTDILVGLNRPAKQRIRFYGPDKFIIADDTVLVMHFLKCRNGNPRLSFFKAEFEKMRIVEAATPGTSAKRI